MGAIRETITVFFFLLVSTSFSLSKAQTIDCVNEDFKTVRNFGIFLIIFGIFLIIFGTVMIVLQCKAAKLDKKGSFYTSEKKEQPSPALYHTNDSMRKDSGTPSTREYDELNKNFEQNDRAGFDEKDDYHNVWL